MWICNDNLADHGVIEEHHWGCKAAILNTIGGGCRIEGKEEKMF